MVMRGVAYKGLATRGTFRVQGQAGRGQEEHGGQGSRLDRAWSGGARSRFKAR